MELPSRTTPGRTDRRAARSRPLLGLAVTLIAACLALGWVEAQEETDDIEFSKVARLAPQALALDAVAVGARLIAVGERGHVLLSDDRGASWTQARVPTRSMLTAATFHDRDLGWAVGHDSVILRTTDGGFSWERMYWAPEDEAPFFDVWFADQSHGIAIGAYGSFFETFDGGESWESRWISDDDWHLHRLAIAADGLMYIAAEAGSIYRSDDGGESWVTLPSPYEGSFFGVLPTEDAVLVYGLRGHLFRSEDSGETWQQVETGTVAMLTDGIVMSDGTIVIVGLAGKTLISRDGGRSFEISQQPDRGGISAVVEHDPGSLFLVGGFGVRTGTLAELTGGAEGVTP